MLQLLSQRDARWKDILLGTSTTTTIGSHGCTITCVSMLADLTPDEVNRRLINVNGYAQTNLIIWSKIHEAIPWLEFEWRGYTYTADDNAKVLDAISKYGGVLVEVDGKPIGGTRHWVLYVGNKRMYDPWDGKEKATSAYPTVYGYAIIKVQTQAGEQPPMNDELSKCNADRDLNWNIANKIAQAVDIKLDPDDKEGSSDRVVKSIAGIRGEAKQAREKAAEMEAKVKQAENTISRLDNRVQEVTLERDSARNKVDEKQQEIDRVNRDLDKAEQDLVRCESNKPKNNIFIWLISLLKK